MKRAIILHGTGGSPESNWFRWLEAELRGHGYEVWLPALPHSERPSLRESVDYTRERLPFPVDDQTLLIGHSSGAILALIIAQELSKPAFGVVGVSVFSNTPSKATEWEANGRLFDVEFDFEAIKAHAGKLLFVHSDNDPYVPLEQARSVADSCQAELIVMPGQGHFNLEQSETYREFPKLVELLEERHFL